MKTHASASGARRTYPEPPIELPLRLDKEPEPRQGCVTCADLEMARKLARGRGDASAVSDCNVRLTTHTHREIRL
ncbi:hypothetical protein [Streptomyces sp. DH12]|uniref:hypothetical protein n=1 Tax=Streptomyces sp. DH12 TaxID=2857010 RepID=UPI001E5030F0|nr:hypothetical protein [Streptomyces sp. DH12]